MLRKWITSLFGVGIVLVAVFHLACSPQQDAAIISGIQATTRATGEVQSISQKVSPIANTIPNGTDYLAVIGLIAGAIQASAPIVEHIISPNVKDSSNAGT